MITVKRKELKYYIRYQDYIILSRVLKKILHYDSYNGPLGGYNVRSVYFDNVFNDAFHEKLDGLEMRKKYRLRVYGPDDKKVKFEIKNKLNDSILKETAIINRDDAKSFLNRDYKPLLRYNNLTLNRIYVEFQKMQFQPIVLIDYIREAFTWPINNIRITFDSKISQNPINLNIFDWKTQKAPVHDGVIMEIKFEDNIPRWILNIFHTTPAVRSAISKYCLSRMEN